MEEYEDVRKGMAENVSCDFQRQVNPGFFSIINLREWGWRSSGSTCLPPIWPGLILRFDIMWVESVAGSRSCSERFSPGTLIFHSPQKPTFPNSNSIWNLRATSLLHVPVVVTDRLVHVSPSLNKVD